MIVIVSIVLFYVKNCGLLVLLSESHSTARPSDSRNLVSFLDKYICCMLAACVHGSSDINSRDRSLAIWLNKGPPRPG